MVNKPGIPKELKVIDHRWELSSEIYWETEGSKVLTSYIVKTSKCMKNVMILSTVQPILGVTTDDASNFQTL